MVAVTNLLSKYTILYGKVMTLVVTILSVARRWTINIHAWYMVQDMVRLPPRRAAPRMPHPKKIHGCHSNRVLAGDLEELGLAWQHGRAGSGGRY